MVTMIDHTGISVRDLAVSRAFYEAALAPLGYGVRLSLPDAVGLGGLQPASGDDPGGDFWLIQSAPMVPRSHIAFRAQSRAEVDAFYRAALQAGALTTDRLACARTTTHAITLPLCMIPIATASRQCSTADDVASYKNRSCSSASQADLLRLYA